ncbi:Immunoglobulin I-set [Trinorchestia longiramus]|nr:Immunoglobulin I-set [Trinorchestia longiramus]
MAHLLDVLLATLFIFSHVSRCAGSESAAPVITLPTVADSFTAEVGTTVEFRCAGTQPVQWHADHYKNLHSEAETVPSNSQSESHIKLKSVSVNHVGYFSCSYVNCNASTSCSTRIYLFVKDEEHLLPMDRVYFLKVPSNQDFMIPCKPSFPGVEVTLTQADGTEVPADFSDIKTGYNITASETMGTFLCHGYFGSTLSAVDFMVSLDYDPREGYQARRSTFTYVRMFTCMGTYGKRSSTSMIEDVKEPYPPRMDVTGAWQMRHANISCYDLLEGMTMELHCIGVPGSDGSPRWEYSASPEQETRLRTVRYDTVTTLIIERARVEDSGAYYCYAGNMFFNSSTIPAFIQVFKNDSAGVSFFDTSNDIHLNEMGNVINWYILFEAHPQIPSFKWTQNGRVLVNTSAGATQAVADRHLLNVTRAHGTVMLRIVRPNMGDVGRHALQACVETPYKVCEEISFSLTVLGGPEEVQGRVEGGSKFVLMNSTVEITCRALGHPRPALSLLYAPCRTPTNCSQYENVTTIVQDNPCSDDGDSSACSLPATAAVRKYRLPFTAPGKFVCHALNEHGSLNSTEGHLIVLESRSDTADLPPLSMDFTVNGPPSKACRNTSVPIDPCTVYAPAMLTLECRANIFYFSDHEPLLFAGHLPLCQPSSECSDLLLLDAVEQSSSHLTRVVGATLNVNIGEEACRCYECIMPSTEGRRNEKLSLRVRVEDTILPYFVGNLSAMLEREVHDKLELACDVEGRPLPHVRWLKDGVEVQPEQNRITIERNGQSLMFEFLMVEDSGQYVCETDSQLNFSSIRQSTALAVSDPEARSKKFLLYAVISFSVVLGIIIIVFLIYLSIQFKERQKQADELTLYFEKGDPDKLTPDMGLNEQAALLPIKKSFEFPRSKLEYERLLGQGAFGMVYRARVRGQIAGQDNPFVAVKKVKSLSNPSHLKGLESEAKIMMHIGKHPNIVNLLGICTAHVRSGELQIIVEYCEHGNLLHYMHSIKSTFVSTLGSGGTLRSNKKTLSNRSGVNYANVEVTEIETDPEHGNSSISSAVPVLRRANSVSSSTNSAYLLNARLQYRPPSSLPNSPTYMGSQPPFIPQNGSGETHCNTIPRSHTMLSADDRALKIEMGSPVNGSVMNNTANYVNLQSGNLMSDMTQLTYAGSTDLLEAQSEKEINTHTLVDWCYQIARGMDYLARHKVLHGDLAARNILLAGKNVVKISDFGFSKQLYNYEYKTEPKGPKPVRWMAIEALRDGVYSTQSDVWAFGVVMWEIFSLGQVPYPTVEINKNFLNQLESGTRLEKPPYASDGLYGIMSRCWLEEPRYRPLFDELQSLLLDFMDAPRRKQYENLDGSNSTQLENSFLSKVRSPDIRCLKAITDDDGYEMPRMVQDSGSSEGGMSRRNIHSLSIPPNQTDEDGQDLYCPMTRPLDSAIASPSPQFYTKMSQSATTPQRIIRSPNRLRSISVSPTIHEETVFNFPSIDTIDAAQEYRKGGHDSGIYGTPGPIVYNREYFDFDQTSSLGSPQVKYERTKGLRRESEASSGTGSLGVPSRESIISSLAAQPIAEEEQIPLVRVQP